MPLALLIDDDSSERSRLARLARAAGFDVQEAPSLAAARAALSKSEPDVALVALTLPDGGGLLTALPTVKTYLIACSTGTAAGATLKIVAAQARNSVTGSRIPVERIARMPWK